MTKLKAILFSAILVFSGVSLQAQSFDISSLDKVTSLFNQGNTKQAASLLGTALSGIKSEVGNSNTSFAPKILSQVGSLSSMIPALTKGNANAGLFAKAISTIKTLLAANRLKGMLGQGSLLGKSNQLTSNVGILQQGLGMMQGGGSVDKISGLLNVVNKKAPKLEKSGLFGKLASKGISKKLGSSLDLLGGLM